MFVMRLILMVFIRLVARAEQGPGVGRDAARKNFPAKEFCLAGELVAVTVFLLLESDTFSPPRNIRQPSGVRVNRRPIFLSVQGGREKG